MKRMIALTLLIGIGTASLSYQVAADTRPERPNFSQLDTDGNGEISADEMQARANGRFAQMDTNGDGVVTATELEEMSSRRVARLMERADANKDGQLTQDEMREARQTQRMARMMERFDTDGSGGLSPEEFRAAGEARKGHRKP